MKKSGNGKENHRIHDNFVREVFNDLSLVRDFLSEWLPKDLLAKTNLDFLKRLPTSEISQALGGSEAIADLLFETKFAGENALLYFLIEHKSYPDKFTPLQAHVYQACAWWSYHRAHPKKKLPLVFTIVLHHGKRTYNYSTDLRDLIAASRDLVEAYVLKPFQLIDLTRVSDDDLTGSATLRAVELVLKHIADKNILTTLEQEVSPLIPSIIKKDDQLALALLKYIMNGSNIEKYQFEEFLSKSVIPIAPAVGEAAMSLAEKLKQEGLQEGRYEERKITAKRMLELGSDDIFVSKVTSLTKEELAELKKQLGKL